MTLSDRQAQDIYRAAVRQKYENKGMKVAFCDTCYGTFAYIESYPLKDGKCKECRKHG